MSSTIGLQVQERCSFVLTNERKALIISVLGAWDGEKPQKVGSFGSVSGCGCIGFHF